MKRIDFIRAIGLAAAGFTLTGFRSMVPFGEKRKVVIVGAGIAGIAAARTLADAGYEVVIIEGRDRTGGRIHTARELGTFVDLGASTIYHSKTNPLTELISANNIPIRVSNRNNFTLYTGNRAKYLEEEITLFQEKSEKVLKKIHKNISKMETDSALRDVINETLKKEELNQKELMGFEWQLAVMEQIRGIELSSMSAFSEHPSSESGDDFLLSGGTSLLLKKLERGLDIRYNEDVRIIKQTKEGASVLTWNETYEGDYVIVTIPVGVLKSTEIRFDPDISHIKKKAIDQIGMGVIDKVFLKYEKSFWDTQNEFIGHTLDKNSPFPYFMNYMYYSKRPILQTCLGNMQAQEMQNWRDEDVIAAVQEGLGRYYKLPPEPQETVITRWAKEKYSKGTHSYLPVGVKSEMRAFLGKAEGKVHWAGEATSVKYPGTMHGAYLSGLQAAEDILKKG